MSETKPTPEELWERAEILFDAAGDRNAMYDMLDEMYDAEEQAAPDGVKFVKGSHFTNTVDLVVDLASQQELTIEVPTRAESEAAEREADEQETFLAEWIRNNDEILKQNTTGELAYLATQRAACIAKVLFYDKSLKQDKDNNFVVEGSPLVCLVRDPRNCAWEIGAGGLTFMAERYERRASEIRSLYPDVLQDYDKYPDDADVDWTEVWTPTHVAYYSAQEPVPVAGQVVRAHGYGVVPYALGVGRVIPRMGVRYQPLMRSIAPICRSLDTWYSILLTSGWAAVTSAWNVFSDSYPIDGSRELDTKPGAVNFFARGDAVQAMQRAPLPGDFFQAGDNLRQMLQQATFPFALFGQVEGSMAGYAINMLTQSGRRALAPVWHAIESCYESVFRLVAIIGKRKLEPLIGDSIPLVIAQADKQEGETKKRRAKRQVSFKLANVGDDWQCQVELGDPMPSDEAANLRMAIESTQAGLLSKRTARSRYKLSQDDTAEQELIQVEKVVDQLAPLEAVKLAARRGYIPRKLELPQGWKQLPDGNIVPDLGNEPPQPQPMGPGGMPPMPQGQPMPQGAPGGEGMPQLPPELLAAMMQGQGQPSAADMQGLSGQPQFVPGLDEMAGEPPEMLPGMM